MILMAMCVVIVMQIAGNENVIVMRMKMICEGLVKYIHVVDDDV
jgi:hypothetical protein